MFRRREMIGLGAASIVACASFTMGAQEDATRSITPEKFLKARPAAAAPAAARPTYRPAEPGKAPLKAPAGSEVIELGVTIWRLRAAKAGDAARLLVQEADNTTQWTPERVPVGAPIAPGDRVRLSIESPRAGYLYVVDREQYADGTSSEPFLIFPTTRMRGGDNKVAGGRLIEIPSQDDRPPFFTMRPSRPDQTGERLTIVVTSEPLKDLAIAAEPLKLARALVDGWESSGSAVERLEMIGGAGRAWSRAEQRAGADATRLLKQDDPPPQTLFRVVVTRPDLVAVNVVLAHGKATGRVR